MHPSALAKRLSLLLLLAIVAFYFYGLGHIPLVGPDEPRYAQVAREMLQRHDLITPTLGGHTWFEKPVLLYWLMMLSYKVLGVSETAARLGPAICGMLTIAGVYWLARQVEAKATNTEAPAYSQYAALACATNLGIFVFSRAASFDILITMAVTWALAMFFAGELEEKRWRRVVLLGAFYLFVGIALLAKGLVGIVIPFGVVGLYFLLRRKLPDRSQLISLLWGIPFALAIAAIWYAPVIAQHGWLFINQFFVQHHFARYLSNKYHHPQPIYFYLLVLFPLTLPWTGFIISSLKNIPRTDWNADGASGKLRLFVLAWLLFPVLFFSFSESKLPGYILPVAPALALLAGEGLSRCIATNRGFWAMQVTAVLFLSFGLTGLIYTQRFGNYSSACRFAFALPLIVAGAVALVDRWKTATPAVLSLALLIALVVTLNCGADRVASLESVKELIQEADARGYSDAPIYALYRDDRTAEFYGSGRLVYGSDGEPAGLDAAISWIRNANTKQKVALLIMPLDDLKQVTEVKSIKADLLASNGRVAMVAIKAQEAHRWQNS